MELEQAQRIIADWVREEYGRFLLLGEVAVLRRASGRAWSGALYLPVDDEIGRAHV